MDGCRTAGGPSSDGRQRRRAVSGARVVSGAEKKAFDRGGPVWPPRSNAADDRLGGGVWGGFAPPAKNRGVWGAAPPSQKRKNSSLRTQEISRVLKLRNALYLYL